MKTERPQLIDSHVHLEQIQTYHPDRIGWLKKHSCSVISWAFGESIRNLGDLIAYWRRQAAIIDRLHLEGLDCYFLAGLHPRNIPADLYPDRLPNLLRPYLSHPYCVGIGEIGLETGSELECDIFRAQLSLAEQLASRHLKVGIHTPRRNKEKMTAKTLEILSDFPDLKHLVVIDHCVPGTITDVLAKGYCAGITLSPVKTSPAELNHIAEICSPHSERIMCNSDSGAEFYGDFIEAAQSNSLIPKHHSDFFCNAASAFFNLNAYHNRKVS